MMALDNEARAARFLDALDAVHDLLVGRAPMLDLEAVPLAQLLGLLNDEAKKVVPRCTPREHCPGVDVANDFAEDA